MDVDFWASRVHSASKHFSSSQAAAHFNYDNPEGDGDGGAFFPCPFCYFEIEVSVLCSHLQEEHCFGLKNAVCPLCAANLGKNAIEHFMVQHSHSLKRRRNFHKNEVKKSNLKEIAKDLRDLNTCLGRTSIFDRQKKNESEADPLIFPFLSNLSQQNPNDIHNSRDSSNDVLVTSTVNRTESSVLDEDHEQEIEERMRRSGFVRQLIFSTIF